MMIPVELIFNPNWWHQNYGICFDERFYLDRQTRVECDLVMRKALSDRFGLGEKQPLPRPILGSMMVAGGFVVPALFGVPIQFSKDAAPWPVSQTLSDAAVMALRPPDLTQTWPLNQLLKDASTLQDEYGTVIGDFDLDGLFNTAIHLRGQQMFVDLIEKPALVQHLLKVLADTYVALVKLLRRLTGTCSIATNRSIINVEPAMFLHSNCSVNMISPALYEKVLLPSELYMAEQLQPYGIHHCGDNLERFISIYSRVSAMFYDVGWGSDVRKCRQVCPEAFLNLRLSPVRVLQCSPADVFSDAITLLKANGSTRQVGLCCINMDAGTPDENIGEMFAAAEQFGKQTSGEE